MTEQTPTEGLGWSSNDLEKIQSGITRQVAENPPPRIEPLRLAGLGKANSSFDNLNRAFAGLTPRGLMEKLLGDTVSAASSEGRCIKEPLGCGRRLVDGTYNVEKVMEGSYFHDMPSLREYGITGRCQACQDSFEEDMRKAEEALERGCEGHPGLGDLTEYCDGSCDPR